ncbi:MAG TPA: hypothetical protein ENI29_23275 [bacterium]|nr:hypothetical protein [bacterium]
MIEVPLIGIIVVAFFLGIKHSFDVDHVIAVSSILVRSPNFSRTFKLSIIWAIGHSFTAGIITIIIFFIKDLFIEKILSNFEIIVAIMLITIGTLTLMWEFKVFSFRKYQNLRLIYKLDIGYSLNSSKNISSQNYVNLKPKSKFFLKIKKDSNAIVTIGVLQGLASNDELFLLLVFTLGLDNLFIIIMGISIFSLGVMVGMILWGSMINLPSLKWKKEKIIKYLNITIASIAITYGIYCLF